MANTFLHYYVRFLKPKYIIIIKKKWNILIFFHRFPIFSYKPSKPNIFLSHYYILYIHTHLVKLFYIYIYIYKFVNFIKKRRDTKHSKSQKDSIKDGVSSIQVTELSICLACCAKIWAGLFPCRRTCSNWDLWSLANYFSLNYFYSIYFRNMHKHTPLILTSIWKFNLIVNSFDIIMCGMIYWVLNKKLIWQSFIG